MTSIEEIKSKAISKERCYTLGGNEKKKAYIINLSGGKMVEVNKTLYKNIKVKIKKC